MFMNNDYLLPNVQNINSIEYLDDAREAFCRAIVARAGLVSAYKSCINNNVTNDIALKLGEELAMTPEVTRRIAYLEKRRVIVRDIEKEDVLMALHGMFTVSVSDYFEVSCTGEWSLKSPTEWTPEMRAACKSVKNTRWGQVLDIHDKMVVVDKIIAMKGFEAPKNNINMNISSKFETMSDDELAKYADAEIVE